MTTVAFSSIKEALAQPVSQHFWISRREGVFESGDPESFYSKNHDFEHLTFDISNNKALVNVGIGGAIKHITFYRSTYGTDGGPGGWTGQDLTTSGPYSFSLELDGQRHDLANVDWPFKTALLDGIFPLTEYTTGNLKITLLTYTPIAQDGTRRPRVAIYGMLVENISTHSISGNVILPTLPKIGKWGEALSPRYVTMSTADSSDQKKPTAIPFSLRPGTWLWVPVIMASPGDWDAIHEINQGGSLAWLNSTWSYYRGITGHLTMPDDPFTAEFLQRSILLCAASVAMDADGSIAGTNFGTYPPVGGINMKDAYYSFLPLFMAEPDLFKRGILWFLEYSVRSRGDYFEGGVTHSLGNSLIPVIMAGFYYAATADRSFFIQTHGMEDRLANILEQVIATKQTDVWLFPSRFISDGYSLGDYHTGSNICAWVAFTSFARILDEVYGNWQTAERYRGIAARIKEAIQTHNTIDGPFGKQYVEGVNVDGSIPAMVHDGEESDTTLMPVYGFAPYDGPIYKSHTRFAVSEHNAAYCPETRGIIWETYGDDASIKPVGPHICDATFPGYVTALANVRDRQSMVGDNGYMSEIRRLTDIDGSIWWWPYDVGGRWGNVSRSIFPKCGWATGVLVTLLVSEFLGLRYDAPTRTLHFRPFSPSSDFIWNDLRLGCSTFGVGCTRDPNQVLVTVKNQNAYSIALDLKIPLPEGTSADTVLIGDKQITAPYQTGTFLGNTTVRLSQHMLPGEDKRATIMIQRAP